MTSFIKCGKCIACTKFNGRNGNGYQPCHRPIPPEVESPSIEILYGDGTISTSVCDSKPSWFLVWVFGLFLGISIGLLIAKSL